MSEVTMDDECGVVYIASGSKYYSKACTSAQSLRSYHPNLPITIFTDQNVEDDLFDEIIRLEDEVDKPGDSILGSAQRKYDRTLYLDADTYVCGDLTGAFEILDKSDIAAALNPGREWWNKEFYNKRGFEIPDTFPEYNTGVLAIKDTEAVSELFDDWNRIYQKTGFEYNQPSFRVALFESEIAPIVLPPEYNFMTMTVGFASGKVKILHQSSSDTDLRQFEKVINKTHKHRVTTWGDYPCEVKTNNDIGWKYLLKKLRQHPNDVKNKLSGIYNSGGMKAVFTKILKKVQ